jgi:hypothetical protein
VELPADLFEDVTGLPAFAPDARSDGELQPRCVFLGQRTTMVMEGGGGAIACFVGRLSVTAVALIHDRPIPVGGAFVLRLYRTGGQPPVDVQCVAVQCDVDGGGLCRSSAVFTAIAPATDVRGRDAVLRLAA